MGVLMRQGVAAHYPSHSMQGVARMMIDLDRILMPEPVPAGMNPYVLMSLAYLYRSSNEHTTPVTLRQEGDYWRITDGRHRFTASVMAGRKQILATEEETQ